jgi:predicted kinase
MLKRVTILRGLPGAGKTHWRKLYRKAAVVCSADDFRVDPVTGEYKYDPAADSTVHRQCFRKYLDALAAGAADVVVDNTNLKAYEIAPYYLAAEAYGYAPLIVWIWCDPGAAFGRNQHGLTEAKTRAMLAATGDLPPWWTLATVTQAVGAWSGGPADAGGPGVA